MEVWSHGGKLYSVVSCYSVAGDTWQYELVGTTEPASVAIIIPDATPDDDRFTPTGSDQALLATADGVVPWLLLMRLIDMAEGAGDLVDDADWRSTAASQGLLSSHTAWPHDGQEYEVNSFHFGDRDAWCYELCAPPSSPERDDFIEVLIPDAQPDAGPFAPAASDRVTVTMHGQWDIPWPVFRRFIEAIRISGDIRDPTA
jgi:hypothetical protein